MTIDRLSSFDAGFFHAEDDVNQLHIGSVLVMEGPAPRYSELRDRVAAKLPLIPRYRQVVRRVPLNLGRPVWTNDRSFNIEHHVRRAALPNPGGTSELFDHVSRTMAQRLDMSKPLWELTMVEGLEDDRWAVIARVHHCMADGVAGVDLLSLILDPSPDYEPPPPAPWNPGEGPTAWQLLADTLGDAVTAPWKIGRALAAGALSPRASARVIGGLVGGAMASARALVPFTGPTSLLGPVGRSRRWVGVSVPIDDIKAVRRVTGATFNDIVLAAVARGLRDLLSLRGEALDGPVRALVPVSGRPRDERGLAIGDGTLANKVAAFFANLPVGLDDPIDRLHAVAAETTKAKGSGQALAADLVGGMSDWAPSPLMSFGIQLAKKVPQRNVSVIATNVPGPQFPLYAAGRRMLRAYPYVPIGMRTRIGLALLSYDGEVTIGVTGDRDSAPDVSVLADGIVTGFDELVEASGAGVKVSGRSRRTRVPAGTGNGLRPLS